MLREAGFARLPRRRDDERPVGAKPEAAAIADAREFELTPRTIKTQFGGIFLFLPYLAQVPLDKILADAGFPGSQMVPAAHAMWSFLAIKLHGERRRGHVMSFVFDEGLALFANQLFTLIDKTSEMLTAIDIASGEAFLLHFLVFGGLAAQKDL